MPRRALAAALLVALCAFAASPAAALDRDAFSIPRYDLKAILDPAEHALSVDGTLELRNISSQPQTTAALQISSSLHWLAIRSNGAPLAWMAQSYTSDIDHTGLLSEAVIELNPPLAPGQSMRLHVRYTGTVTRDATRLERIGMPPAVALRSDWDQIGNRFTALRGVGYVVWYPVSMEAASLSEGDQLYETLRGWRRREASSVLRLHLVQAPSASSADVSSAADHAAPANASTVLRSVFVGNGSGAASGPELTQEFSGVEPVLVLLHDAAQSPVRPHLAAYYTAAHAAAARKLVDAAEAVLPPLEQWFGAPRRKVVLVELADSQALPYEAGSWYFTPLHRLSSTEQKDAAELAVTPAVVHASFDSPRPWIREGLACFAQALVRELQAGRAAALGYLGQFAPALASAEAEAQLPAPASPASKDAKTSPDPASPPSIGAQPLTATADAIFYRGKAAYVWWMLRDQLGDRALQAGLAAYRPADDRDPGYLQRLLEAQLSPHRDLTAFFNDWVYRDRGLPRLRLLSAYTRTTVRGQTVTAVTVKNLGNASCEVPVLVRSANSEARQRLFVPAHGKAIIRVPMAGTPTEAIVNDGSVPEADQAGHRLAVTLSRPSSY